LLLLLLLLLSRTSIDTAIQLRTTKASDECTRDDAHLSFELPTDLTACLHGWSRYRRILTNGVVGGRLIVDVEMICCQWRCGRVLLLGDVLISAVGNYWQVNES